VIVIMNNARLGMTTKGMANRAVAGDFSDVDFAGIARSMGADGRRLNRPGNAGEAVRPAKNCWLRLGGRMQHDLAQAWRVLCLNR